MNKQQLVSGNRFFFLETQENFRRRYRTAIIAIWYSPLIGRFYLHWALFRSGNKYVCIVIEKTIYPSGWWQQYSNSYNQTRSWAAKPVIFLKPSNRPSNIWPFKDGNCSIYWLLNFSNGYYGCLVYIVHNNLMFMY